MSDSQTEVNKEEIPPNNEAKVEPTKEPTEIDKLQSKVKELEEESKFLLDVLITAARQLDDLGFQQMALSRGIAKALRDRKMAE